MLAEVAWPAGDGPLVYVCGPNGFVEAVAATLVALGHEPGRIRTERFGPGSMTALDGNAMAGPLHDVFGAEMTTAVGTCAGCGETAQVAEVAVYMRGPGIVARCRRCDAAQIVLVTIRGTTCVDLRGLAALEHGV